MDWLIVFIGIVIGAVVTAYVFCRNFVGTLRVDQSDPTDAPYLFLEIEKGMGDISRKKYVLLRVNTESYIMKHSFVCPVGLYLLRGHLAPHWKSPR